MMHRVLIEFVVDLPNPNVARDVETRLVREHGDRLCETLKAVTGYAPLNAPGRVGVLVSHEPVVWSNDEQDWIGESGHEDEEDE